MFQSSIVWIDLCFGFQFFLDVKYPSSVCLFGCRVRAYLRTRRGNLLTTTNKSHTHKKEVIKSTDKIRIKKGLHRMLESFSYSFEFRPFMSERSLYRIGLNSSFHYLKNTKDQTTRFLTKVNFNSLFLYEKGQFRKWYLPELGLSVENVLSFTVFWK